MEAKKMFDDKMQQLKNRSQYYEKRIGDKLHELKEWADPGAIWGKIKSGATSVATDRRTVYVVLGIVVSFFVVKALMGRRRSRQMLLSDSGVLSSESFDISDRAPIIRGRKENRSLLYEMVIMAVQTFLLHYARKMLINFLENRDKKGELPAAETPPQS